MNQEAESTATEIAGATSTVLFYESQLAAIQEKLGEAKQRLMELLEESGQKSAVVVSNGKRHRYTYSKRRSLQINEQGLKKALGARQFNKYTERKLDRKKFEHAVDIGEIDPMIIAPYIDTKTSNAYLTHRVEEETE